MAAKRAEIDARRRYVDHQFAVVNLSAEVGNVVRGGGQGNFDLKGTVSQTAHVQVINQKWSDVFKFVICEQNGVNKRRTILTVTQAVETTLAVSSFFLIPAAAGKRNGRSREEEFGSK